MADELQNLEQSETMQFNAQLKVHWHGVLILFSARLHGAETLILTEQVPAPTRWWEGGRKALHVF